MKYLFIENSTKPTYEQQISRDKVMLTNVTIPCVEAALALGYEVIIGVNRIHPEDLTCDYAVKFYNSSTYRSLLDLRSNYSAYKNLMAVLKENKIDVIHCNTPIGGLMGRLCGKRTKVRKIIYTVHGFHFYQGAPLLNNTVFKWAEVWLARYTDAIITINREDFEAARRLRLRNHGNVYYVPGVGINTDEYQMELPSANKQRIRKELGLRDDDIVLISMGDLVKGKNYSVSIKAVAKANDPRLHYLICGEGPWRDKLVSLSKTLGIEKQVHLLGFRTDIKELLKIADIFLFTSYREGLPRSTMEAMAGGLPCIVSRIRGNIDLIENGKGGYLYEPADTNGFAEAVRILASNKELAGQMGRYNRQVVRNFDIANVKESMKNIYEEVLT